MLFKILLIASKCPFKSSNTQKTLDFMLATTWIEMRAEMTLRDWIKFYFEIDDLERQWQGVILCSHHNINKDRQRKKKLMRLLLSIRDPELNILLGMIISMFLLMFSTKKKINIVMQPMCTNHNNCLRSVWLWFCDGQCRNSVLTKF